MPPRADQQPEHDTWLTDLREAHQEHFGVPPQSIARVPGSWPLIGEHSDPFGGISLHVLCDADTRLSLSPTHTAQLRIRWEEADAPALHIDADINTLVQALQEGSEDHQPGTDDEELASLLALTMSSLHQRQMLSRSVHGADILIRSTIPHQAGLGLLSSIHVAFALAATCSEEGVDVPTRARLADVLAHSAAVIAPARPALSRLHALLRAQDSGHGVVDHADGAVTRSPSILTPGTQAWLVRPAPAGAAPAPTEEVRASLAQRFALAQRAAHDFGTAHLRLLPHAPTRVPEWLAAYRHVHGPEGQPSPDEAATWLGFWEAETQRAAKLNSTLHAQHHSTAWTLINDSARALRENYGLSTPDAALAQLCLRAGAAAARPVLAGLSTACIAYTTPSSPVETPEVLSTLSAHGLHVLELHEGHPSSVTVLSPRQVSAEGD